eukprot:CAMPEP_0184475782 /NCGR_PEP_ID=MMETSP0740-20130409/146744_1 /TAXON_ID=385413 /ORGANISM="Thalassiosira miniscula, Strain CCMP1093" /LENGTH=257 /DNA_ID=CAMNT_0026853317 /DNA_START=13 /DNA_END=787 /DNA_ORIENTATION=-
MKTTALLAAALTLGSTSAFTTMSPMARPATTTLSMAKNDDESNSAKTFAASALAAAYLLTGVVSADAAFAMDNYEPSSSVPSFVDSSSVVLAGRSGGRAGGRASPRAMPRTAAPAASSKTVINKTTVIAPPSPVVVGGGLDMVIALPSPVVVGGGYGYGGYGYGGGYYDPTPGIALNLGLSAVSAVGNGMREARQNEMIANDRAELRAAQQREAEMSERLRQLEMMQMQQGRGGQAPPQVIYAQPPVVQQMAPVPQQ